MHYSKKVKRLFEYGLRPCEFVVRDWKTGAEKVCGGKTTAVYVSDDSRKEFTPICAAHRDAAWAGDGPVWDLVPVYARKA